MAQTKLTLTGLATLVAAYVDKELQLIEAEDYELDRESFSGLLVKVGKQIMQDSTFTDRLSEFDSEELPFGTTIEEYFINLLMPTDHDPSGSNAMAPDDPNFEDAVYTKQLPRKTFKQTVRDNVYEKAMLSQADLSSVISNVVKRLKDSQIVYKYNVKRQLLGNLADFAVAAQADNANLTIVHKHAVPNDNASGESFIKLIKSRVTQLALMQTETNNMGNVLAVAPSLMLYINVDKATELVPSIDVDTLAGAFNKDKVEIPIEVKQLENFGTMEEDENVYAILLDPRGVALHPHRPNYKTQDNGEGEFINLFAHETYIGYLSKFTNVNVFTTTGLIF